MFSYSVAIRTLGTAGEKYEKLLNSIKKQTVSPEKIVVVLPEGYKPPDKILGNEIFVFSKKGMVYQRFEASKYITSDFTFFCDDDVEFDEDFIEKLAQPLISGEYFASAGPLLDFFPPAGVKYLLASLLGGACRMLFGRKNTYTRILKDGGWSYNRSIKTNEHLIYNAESLAGTCFFINTEAFKKIKFDEEDWLERFNYAAFEDRVMFYKLLLNNMKSCVVSDALYIHNDGKASTVNLKLEPFYARAFNHYIFWHRYIYNFQKSILKKVYANICINYYMFMQKIYYKKNKPVYDVVCKGFIDAKKFVKSDEYKNLNGVLI